MAWIIKRIRGSLTRKPEEQMLMDNFRIDRSGTFRDIDNPGEGIQLPLVFDTFVRAQWEKRKLEEEEPEWHYRIDLYLR